MRSGPFLVAGLLVGCAQGGADEGVPPIQESAQAVTGNLSSSTPGPLRERLIELNDCQSRLQETHATYPVQKIQAEGGTPILYGYYNLDEQFLHNPFTESTTGINDECELFTNDAIGSVRAVLEPKPGAVVDPSDPRSLIDIFTDVCGLRVINNESGWYEGWLVHDLVIPSVKEADGRPTFGHITQADATRLKAMGSGHNVPGRVFTKDGGDTSFFNRRNTVTLVVSLGAWNTLQGEDGHAYWELNSYTNWTYPLYEIFSTGGEPADYAAGKQYAPLGGGTPDVDSRIPGSGPLGILHRSIADRVMFGDDPDNPREPDRDPEVCGEEEGLGGQAEARLRFIPSGLAREVLIDAWLRPASFEPNVTDMTQRLLDAYAKEVARVDENRDGVVSFTEVDIEDESDGQPNARLYLAPNRFNRIVITKELDDGLLAPRFAPNVSAMVMWGRASFLEVKPFVVPGGDED
jgi:hypothetical protein